MIGWRQNAPARAYIAPPEPIRIEHVVKPRPVKAVEAPKLVLAPSPLPLPGLSLRIIQDAVAGHYGIDLTDLLGPSSKYHLARPRQLAMYLCRHLTERSLPEIGRAFGGRDHSTVIHAIRAVEGRLAINPDIRADHAAILEALGK